MFSFIVNSSKHTILYNHFDFYFSILDLHLISRFKSKRNLPFLDSRSLKMWGVFLLSIVIALNLFAAVALTQVYDPALVFLSIPNYMIIHTWMTKFKDIRIS